jgi:hypothetical protein
LVDICEDSNYLATPYCPRVVSKVFVRRPYAVDPAVGDLAYEQPSYYCNIHNPNLSVYPIDPNVAYTPDNSWNSNPDSGWDWGDGWSDGWNDGGWNSGGWNGGESDPGGTPPPTTGGENETEPEPGTGNEPPDDGSQPPAWLNFSN